MSASSEVSEDGPLFLHILVSRAVCGQLLYCVLFQHQMTCLDQLMAKVNCNITTIINEVQDILHQLES